MKKIIVVVMAALCLSVNAGDTWSTAGKVLAADKGIKLITGTSPVDQVVGKVGGLLKGTNSQNGSQVPTHYPVRQYPYISSPQGQTQYSTYPPVTSVPTQNVQYRVNPQYVKVWQSNIVQGWCYQQSQTRFARNAKGESFKYEIKVFREGPVDKGRYIYVPEAMAHNYQPQPEPVFVDTMKTIGGRVQTGVPASAQDIPDISATEVK